MAYSFRDHYRPLRLLLRIDGTLSLISGPLILLFPQSLPTVGGVATLWPLRLVGAMLMALGLLLISAANERLIERSLLLALSVGCVLATLVLLGAYLQGPLGSGSTMQQVGLVALFVLLLASAVVPLRYVRVDYRS